ncbi:MAG: SPFH domain-containing protein [Eubacteriales bacterium]
MEYVIMGLVIVIIIISGIRVVPENMWYVVERFGSYHATLEPGVHIIIILMDRIVNKISKEKIEIEVKEYLIKAGDRTEFILKPYVTYSVVDPIGFTYCLGAQKKLEKVIVEMVKAQFKNRSVYEINRMQKQLGDTMKRELLEKSEKYGIKIHYFRLKTQMK